MICPMLAKSHLPDVCPMVSQKRYWNKSGKSTLDPKYVTSLISGESLEIPPKSSRYSQHPPPRCPRNVSGTKMKNRFLMMIFDDDVILDDDVIFDDDVMLM